MVWGENWFLSRENKESGKKEREAKVLEINPGHVEQRLKETGASLIFKGEVVNISFDTADNQLDMHGFRARVRRVTESRFDKQKNAWVPQTPYFVWTVKGPKKKRSQNKSRREWESGSRFKSEAEALASLQKKVANLTDVTSTLVEKRRVVKERTSYAYPSELGGLLGGVHVDIDTLSAVSVNGAEPKSVVVPTFLEIETVGELSGRRANERIEACADALGLTLDPEQRKWSESDLLRHYKIIPQ